MAAAADTPDSPEVTSPGLGRSLGLMGSANVVAFGSGIVRQKIFAVFLGPGGYGVFGVLASLFDLLSTITAFGVPAGLLREASGAMRKGDPGAVVRMLRIVRFALVGLSLAVLLVTVVLSPLLSRRLGVPSGWIILLACGLPAVALTVTSEATINAFGHIRRLALSKVLTTLSSLALMAVLVSLFGLFGGVLQLVTGAVLGALMSYALLRGPLRKAARSPAIEHEPEGPLTGGHASNAQANGAALGSRQLLTAVFAVGVAQSLVHAAATLNLFAFRSMILVDLGEVQSGLYQGAMGLSRQYSAAFMAALFVHVYPALSRVVGDRVDFRGEIARALRFVLGVSVPVALVLLASRDFLVALVFTSEFTEMVPLMMWTIPVDALVIALGVLRMAVLASADNRAFVVLGVGFEVIYAISFVVGMRMAGLQGAVAAYGVAAVFGLILFGGHLARRGLLGLPRALALRGCAGVVLLVAAALLPLGPASRGLMGSVAGLWLYLEASELKRAFS